MKFFLKCVVTTTLLATFLSVTLLAQTPVVTINPDSIQVALDECNDTVSVPIQIGNSGTAPLFYSVLQISDFYDDFEDGLGNWIASSNWGLESPGHQGEYFLTESPNGSYGNSWNEYITLKDSLIVAMKDSLKLSFYLKYSLECGYDYLYVQISVNNGSWQTLQTFNCPSTGWNLIQYNLGSYVNDGDYIKIRYYFHSDGSVVYDGVGIDEVRIKGIGNLVNWVFFPAPSGVVMPGLSETMNVGITSTNLLTGNYQYVITILTNDPVTPQVFVPVTLDFTGYPLLNPLVTFHDFGSLFENANNIDTVQITNTGCDTLIITDITTSASQFIVLQNQFTALPGHIINVPVKFLPDAPGQFTSDLYVSCNDINIDPAVSIMQLTGTGLPAPVISVHPAGIEETIHCGDSVIVNLVIHNNGQSSLEFNLSNFNTSGLILHYPLDGNAVDYTAFDRDGTVNGAVPTTDRLGSEGKALLFDGTNDYVDVPDGVYFNGNFTVNAWVYETAYKSWSRLFDFGNGAPSDNVLGAMSRGTTGQYVAEVYYNNISGGQFYNTTALPLNQWIMITQVLEGSNVRVYSNGNLIRSGTTSQLPKDITRVNNYLGRSNWSGDYYYQGKIDDFRIYNRALTPTEISEMYTEENAVWLTNLPDSGSVAAEDSIVITVTLNALSLVEGDYSASITIKSNDPVNPEVTIPVTLHVYGEPIISSDTSTLNFGTTMQFVPVNLPLNIFNQGCDSLHISSFEIANEGFTVLNPEAPLRIPPNDSITATVEFMPADTGEYSSVMTIINDASNLEILLTGYASGAPHMVLTPDTSFALIVTCGDSVENSGTISNTGYVDLNWTAYNQSGGGQALSFDSYGEWVNIGNFGTMPEQGCIEFWTWTNLWQSYNNAFCTNGLSNTNVGVRFEEYSSGLFLAVVGNDAATYTGFTLTNTLETNVWHHVAMSWDKSQNKVWFYLDGNQVINGASCTTWATNWTDMIIGAGWTSSRWWNGLIDEFRIWNYCRSYPEISMTMNFNMTGNETGLLAYWNFNEGSGTTLNDLTGNGHNGTFSGATWVESTIPLNSFVTVSPASGTIAPGDSQELTFKFKSGNMNSGSYNSILPFVTNDPQNILTLHPCVMEMTGSPAISVNPAELHFGELMAGATTFQELTIYNTGCDTLIIDSLDYNSPDIFYFGSLPFTVLPHDSTVINVRFSPLLATYYEDLVHFYSNTEPLSIFIDGTGIEAPSISFDPALLEAWVNCSDSTHVPLTVYNNGLADLIIDFHGAGSASGVPVPASCTPQTYGYCCSMGILHFKLNTIDTVTGDGVEGYQDYTATQRTVLLPGQSYPMEIQTGPQYSEHVAVWIDYNNNGVFEDNENVLVSYYGPIHTGTITVPTDAVMNTALRLRVASEYYYNGVPTPCSTPEYGQDEDYTVFIVSGVYPPLITDTIYPLSSETYDVMFSGNLLTTGDYTGNFSITTNDPVHPNVEVPFLLNVGGGANFTLPDNYHDFGNVMIHTSSVFSVNLHNGGCDTLFITEIYSDNAVFSGNYDSLILPPGHAIDLTIVFAPDTVSYYEGNVYLNTNVGVFNVFMVGYGTPAPSIAVDPDVLNVQVTCGESIEVPVNVYNNGEEVLHYQLSFHPELDSGLLMYYPFEGNANDFSSNNRNLTNHGAQLTTGNTGLAESAYSFNDGATMTYDNTSDLISNLFQNQVTLSFWVKFPDPSTWQNSYPVLMSISGYYYGYDGIYIQADEWNIYAKFRVNWDYYELSCPTQIDTWMHLAYTFDGNIIKAYVNGTLYSSYEIAGTMPYYTNYPAFILGNWNYYPDDNSFFTGDMDEFRYYGRALSANEIGLLSSNVPHLLNMQADPVIDSIGPSDYHQVNVTISTENMITGVYHDVIDIISDDPLHPHVFIPLNLEVIGTPQIMVSPDCLYYDTIMQFTTQTKEILIENSSCTPLFVSNMYAGTESFHPEFPNVIVPPFGSNTVPVIFNPVTEGYNEDTLYIESEAGLVKICLQGYCTGIPVAVVNPTSINQVLSCEEEVTLSIQIRNEGLAAMEYQVNAPVLSWFSGINESGSLDPGGEATINFSLDRIEVPTGLYNTLIHVTSSDPLHPSIQIPVYLLIPNPLVPVYLGADTGYCIGSTYTLHAGNYSTYLWNDGSTASTLVVTTPGLYWVDVVDYYNCPSSDTIYVSEFPIPTALAGNDTLVCEGTSVFLRGNSENTIPPFPLEIVVGSGTNYTTNTGPNPFGTYYMDHRSQYLYRHNELMEAGLRPGNITALGFILNGLGSPGMNNFNIRIKTTHVTSLSHFESDFTEVFSMSYYYPVIGQNVFTLDEPYFWDGSSSLIIEVCFDNNGWVSNSSYQYTNTTGCVMARYCDNCAPGCSLGGESAYSERPNLIIHGDGDITIYEWTGPAGYHSMLRNPVITNVGLSQSGTYTLSVNNGFGCTGTDQKTVSVDPMPIVDAGPDGNILGGEWYDFNPVITGGVQPYTYYWSPSTYLNDSSLLQARSTPIFTTTYTLNVTGSNGCYNSDQLTVTVVPRFSLSGHITYNNILFSALEGVKILLKNNAGVRIDSTTTDQSGNYFFPYLLEGTYQVIASTNMQAGSINATDALVIGKHVVGLENLTGLPLKAADVNASNTVSGGDALLVLHYTVGNISIFPAGRWYFEQKNVTIAGADNVADLKGICIGDVNLSFIPGLKNKPVLNQAIEGVVTAAAGERFTLPIRIREGMTVGAASLHVRIPQQFFLLEDVIMPEGTLVYRTADNILHIGWNNNDGIRLQPQEVLLLLKLRRTSSSPPEDVGIGLTGDCELADVSAQVINYQTLLFPLILNSEQYPEGFWLGQNQPNPLNYTSTIPYYLPEDGEINFEIFNVLGETVLQTDEGLKSEGQHTLIVSGKDLPNGVYHYHMTYRSKSHFLKQTRSLIISK